MPFRPQELDTGFFTYNTPEPETKPVEPVKTLDAIGALFTGDSETTSRATRETLDTVGAAFRMENDIVNAVSLMTRPSAPSDPSFDVAARLKADGLWNDYAENFLGVDSEVEYLDVSNRIAQEERDRLTLAAAGTGGLIAQMAAGMISPTMLIPFVGAGAKGAKAIAIGAAAGLAGGAAQELPLQLAQETRSLGESVSSIAMSTVVGGVLGGAIAYSNRSLAQITKEVDTYHARGASAIPGSGRATTAGAEGLMRDVQLQPSIGTVETVGQISPVVRGLTSPFLQARWMMGQLADAGLEVTGKGVAAVGGTVENRIKTYWGPVDQVMRGLDESYAQYWFGQGVNKPFAVTRANIAGLNPNRVKLARQEFKQAIGDAMNNGDLHDIPEVAQMAQLIRRKIYEPLLKLAREVGLLKEVDEAAVVGDRSYLNRTYNLELIQARQDRFEDILASHYEQKLVDEFRASFNKFQKQQQRGTEAIEDFRRSPEDVAKLREQFEEQLKALDEGRDADLVELEDAISDKRSTARTFESGTPERTRALEEARALEQEGGEALAATREQRATIRRRLANLRRAHSALSARQEAKLDKIARAEDLSFNTLQRLGRRFQKALGELEALDDDALNAELSKLKDQFAAAAKRYDKNEERIATVFDDEFEADLPTSPFVQAAKVESATFDKMTDLAERIDDLDAFDRQAARDQIQAMLDDATMRAQSIVERRAVRNARLSAQAQELDPELGAKRIANLEDDLGNRRTEFFEQWRERGADDIDPATGATNFKKFSKDMAHVTTNKILGTHMRLPGMDIILEPRGPELVRTLDIDSNLLKDVDGRSFLELDIEKQVLSYVRTMAPDIELTRAFGDFAPDLGRNEQWLRLDEEITAYKSQIQEQMRQGINPKTGKPQTYTTEEIDKRGIEISQEAARTRRDMEAVIGRMRHTWGVPKDPRAFGARAAKIASNVNVLRYMGGVVISSLPDVGRPIMKHGLLRTFKDGYIPFLKGLGKLQLTTRQLRQAGAALDVTLHSRATQMYDLGDYTVRGSKFEKALDYGSSKIGLIAVFDYWTAAMKQIVGGIANARAMDALNVVAGGGKASAKDAEEAVRFLAANGIDDATALRIWKQVQAGGGEEVNGQWWPNTEDWTDVEAVRAYNALLVREVDNSIITPGVERPVFMDSNPFWRLVTQFKSFGMSSTTRTFLAGAQSMRQGDMAFVTGGMISLAMGTLSYYIWANITGGQAKADMEAALAKGDWGKFADEAINRSGLLGVGADLQSAFAAIPATAPYVSFSGERTTRRGGGNLLETMFGPTFGDLANTGANILTGSDDPTQATAHQVRTLLPLQNHFILRHLYDLIEAGVKDRLPERRNDN